MLYVVWQEGDFTFSLESVMKLGDLLGSTNKTAKKSFDMATIDSVAVCADPSLPVEFQPLCQSKEAGTAISRLAKISANYDTCEICAFAACTGC